MNAGHVGTSGPVIVMGMHRSGTSFLVRALNLCGLWLGHHEQLVSVEGRAMPGNPKGNYESNVAVEINNTLLQRSGGAWFNPPQGLTPASQDLDRMRLLCDQLKRGRPQDFPRWGWKDPRMVLTLNAWIETIGRDGFLVGSFRNPLTVARSLSMRDGIPLAAGLTLWGIYNAALLEHLQDLPHMLVRFDVAPDVLVDQVAAVSRRCGLREESVRINEWFDPTLVRSEPASATVQLPDAVNRIWEQLLLLHETQAIETRR